MNYTELTASLQSWLEDFGDEFVAAIPGIVRQAEDRLYRAVRVPALRKGTVLAAPAHTRFLTLPADYRAPVSLALVDAAGAYHYLPQKDPTFIGEAYPSPTAYAQPRFYAVVDDDSLVLGPVSDLSYQYDLQYWFRPESIVTAGTSWIGTNAESVLFYACLAEAYVYLKGEGDLTTKYRAQYDEAVALLNAQGAMVRTDEFRIPAAA